MSTASLASTGKRTSPASSSTSPSATRTAASASCGRARGQRDLITVIGRAATIAAGEFIQVSGQWVNDRTHRVQFRANFLRSAPPTTAEGIERYLASGMIKGIGPVYARKLAKAFRDQVFDVIEQTPDRLQEIDGSEKGNIEIEESKGRTVPIKIITLF